MTNTSAPRNHRTVPSTFDTYRRATFVEASYGLPDDPRLAGTSEGVTGSPDSDSGCAAVGCPGCAPLTADLEPRLAAYTPTTFTAQWPKVAAQCRCLVRRTAPCSASILAGRLATLWRIVGPMVADAPEARVASLVSTTAVNRMLVELEVTHTQRTRANIAAAARALVAAAESRPHVRTNVRDDASSGPATSRRTLSPRLEAARDALCQSTAVAAVLAEHPVTFTGLDLICAHLPTAVLSEHRDALRG